MSVINFPLLYIPDPNKGRPLFNGQIFVGEPDLDPEITGNQKQLNVVTESGDTVPVNQPFTLSAGGVPTYNGDPVRLDVDGNYSIKILNRLGAQEYYIENVFEGQPVTSEEFEAALVGVIKGYTLTEALGLESAVIGQQVIISDRNNSLYEYIAQETANGIDLNDATDSGLTLAYIVNGDIDILDLGAEYDGRDLTDIIERSNVIASENSVWSIVNGDAKCNLDIADQDVLIKGEGSLSPFIRTAPALKASSEFATDTAVTLIETVTGNIGARSDATVSKVTSASNGLQAGDVVKVISEDVIPTTTLAEGCRNGEWAAVLSVSGDDVYLNRVLEESYSSAVRIGKISPHACNLDISVKSTYGNGSAGSALVLLQGFYQPKLNLNLSDNDGVGLALHSCYQATGDVFVKNLTNDTGNGIFGYGVIDAGCGLTDLTIHQTGFVRHAYTTGVASKTDDSFHAYGEPWAIMINGASEGAESNAWDTHSQGNGITFNVETYGCQSMFQSRCRKVRAVHPAGSDALYLAQVRSTDTSNIAELEVTGANVRNIKKPFNIKDDADSTTPPSLVLRGDSYIEYEPTTPSAALTVEGNISIYGSVRFKMTGGTDFNYWQQSVGNANIYGNVIFDSVSGVVTKPFNVIDSNFNILEPQGGHVEISSQSIGKLFTSTSSGTALTSNIKANGVNVNVSLPPSNWFEFDFNTQQLTITSDFSQTEFSSFQFIGTAGGNTDIVFDSLDSVIYLQFNTDGGSNAITSISDGNYPGQKLFIDNASGSTLSIPNSLANVEYSKSISVNTTDELTWRGTYWA